MGETLREPRGFDWLDLSFVLRTEADFSTYAPTERLGLYEAITQVGADWVIDTRSGSDLTFADMRNTHDAAKSLGCHLTRVCGERQSYLSAAVTSENRMFSTCLSDLGGISAAAVTARFGLNRSCSRGSA